MKNKATILLFFYAVAGIALGVFFLIFGLKMGNLEDKPQYLSVDDVISPEDGVYFDGKVVYLDNPNTVLLNQNGEDAGTMVSKTIYICVGSIFAFVSASIAILTLVKLAKEEEENQAQ